ncbi:MAG: hypothetical protein FDW93_03310 [Bergeyella sp.]|nr:hypothetical protein [Bergeyella sp.]
MVRLGRSAASLVCFLFLYSCSPSKDEMGDRLEGLGIAVTQVKFLKNLEIYSKYYPNGSSYVNLNFKYSGEKLTSYMQEKTGFESKIEYNQAKKITKITAQDGAYSDFTYDKDNRLLSIQRTSGENKDVVRLFYSDAGDSPISISKKSTRGSGYVLSEMDNFTYDESGKNILQIESKTKVADGINVSNKYVVSTYAYDKKNSPFKLFPKEFILFLCTIEHIGGYALSANNSFTLEIKYNGEVVNKLTMSSLYDTDNYLTYQKSGNAYYSKFLYSKLGKQ